ncbi:MAG: exodeoxyribonuclease VII large subunit, partial [Rikenellaceae bacterium]|nr:exodeoxyribonuclease VII large subunit [Rikenellaceae bacterium]
IWRSQWAMISPYFRGVTGKDLTAGMKILVRVSVVYHELYGLSLQIADIEPSYTLGDLAAQRRETIERLQKEGVFEMNRECALPPVIQRLAVISSAQAAGFRDFHRELFENEFGYAFRADLYEAFMQGRGAEDSIINALDGIAENPEKYDAVVLIRGGGSQSDLGAFDSYRLCSHLAQFPLPVVTGIGHDKDQSVADLVARAAMKTPTAVAGFFIDHNRRFEDDLLALGDEIGSLVRNVLAEERERLVSLSHAMERLVSGLLYGHSRRLDELQVRLHHDACLSLEERRGRLALLASTITHAACRRLAEETFRIVSLGQRITDTTRQFLAGKQRELALWEEVVEARRPEHILKMGYAVVRSGGRIIKNVETVGVGEGLQVQLRDGILETEVKQVVKT